MADDRSAGAQNHRHEHRARMWLEAVARCHQRERLRAALGHLRAMNDDRVDAGPRLRNDHALDVVAGILGAGTQALPRGV